MALHEDRFTALMQQLDGLPPRAAFERLVTEVIETDGDFVPGEHLTLIRVHGISAIGATQEHAAARWCAQAKLKLLSAA